MKIPPFTNQSTMAVRNPPLRGVATASALPPAVVAEPVAGTELAALSAAVLLEPPALSDAGDWADVSCAATGGIPPTRRKKLRTQGASRCASAHRSGTPETTMANRHLPTDWPTIPTPVAGIVPAPGQSVNRSFPFEMREWSGRPDQPRASTE